MERARKYTEAESIALAGKWLPMILPKVQDGNHGKYLAIDLESGEYELDADPISACHRLRDRLPDAHGLLERIGHPGGPKLGSRGFKVIR